MGNWSVVCRRSPGRKPTTSPSVIGIVPHRPVGGDVFHQRQPHHFILTCCFLRTGEVNHQTFLSISHCPTPCEKHSIRGLNRLNPPSAVLDSTRFRLINGIISIFDFPSRSVPSRATLTASPPHFIRPIQYPFVIRPPSPGGSDDRWMVDQLSSEFLL
jgi:hypothetical protein